jgi:hypothetical protein
MTYAAAQREHPHRLRRVRHAAAQPRASRKSLSTLDQLSGGRLRSASARGKHGRCRADADPATFIARFIEGVRLMKACWTETGDHVRRTVLQLRGVAMEPKPFQKPYPRYSSAADTRTRRRCPPGGGFFGAALPPLPSSGGT